MTIIHPAFDSLTPNIVWKNCADEQNKQLSIWSGVNDSWQKLVTSQTFPLGYYRSINAPKRFIKILSKKHGIITQAAEDIVQYLAIHFDRVIEAKIVNRSICYQGNEAALFTFAYIDSDIETLTPSDFYELGKQLSHLHQHLKSYPNKEKVIARSLTRMAQLRTCWQDVLDKKGLSGIPELPLYIVSNEKLEALDILLKNPEHIHGDLNRGNILFTKNKSKTSCFFIDFEDSLYSYFNPLQDLAFVIERLILVNSNATFEQWQNSFSMLLNGYISISSKAKNWFLEVNWLSKTLTALTIKALLILIESNILSKDSPALSEWEKFTQLYQFIQENHENINRLTKTWLATENTNV